MYDPPEPTEEEMEEYDVEQAVMNAPTVSITGLTPESVQVIIRQTLRSSYNFEERAQEMLREMVKKAAESLLTEEATKQIRALVTAVLAEGFAEHTRYGEKTGERTTARELIIQQLTEKTSDNYGRGPQISVAARIAETVIKERFAKEFDDELKRAKEAFRSQVDELLKGKLVTSLKEALGLK